MFLKNTKAVAIFVLSLGIMANNLQATNLSEAELNTVLFGYAQEELPRLTLKIKVLEKEKHKNKKVLRELHDKKKVLVIINLIAKGDIKTLASLSKEQLSFNKKGGQIEVEGSQFIAALKAISYPEPEKLLSVVWSGENALAFVLLYSTTTKSYKTQEKTLDMLTILLDKGLDVNSKVAYGFFVMDESKAHIIDYPVVYTLNEYVSDYCSKEVRTLLRKHGMR